MQINNILEEYSRIYKKVFIKKTFIKLLFSLIGKYKQNELIDYHPTELGHKLWAEFLYSYINKKNG